MLSNSKRNKSDLNKYNVLDLFSGAGGFSYGFQSAGFNIKVANEIDVHAIKTHNYNFKDSIMIDGNINDKKIKTKIITESIKHKVNIIIGGPPCKGFSLSGNQDPRDSRSQLYIDYLDIVNAVQPEVFVIENVPNIKNISIFPRKISEDLKSKYKTEIDRFNILQDKKNNKKISNIELSEYKVLFKIIKKNICTNALAEIIKISNQIGYKIWHNVLLASEYGVPQKRKRIIIIGSRKCNPELAIPEKKDGVKTVKDSIDDLKNKPENKKLSHIFRKYKNKTIPQKILDCDYGKSYTGTYAEANNKCHPDKPANTVKENHGGVMTHYELGRHLTPRELARLQSFPDTFLFPCSKTYTLKQIGNAVPCLLAEAIGKGVKKIIQL